jgi:hypothetical protein
MSRSGKETMVANKTNALANLWKEITNMGGTPVSINKNWTVRILIIAIQKQWKLETQIYPCAFLQRVDLLLNVKG